MTSGDPPTSASQNAGITGSYSVTPAGVQLHNDISLQLTTPGLRKRGSICFWGGLRELLPRAEGKMGTGTSHDESRSQQSLALSPRLEYSGAILAHYNLCLLYSSYYSASAYLSQGFTMLARMICLPRDPPASASQSAGITGMSHRAWPMPRILSMTLRMTELKILRIS
ncbi:hypothetical protein AAY473_018866, partial [Plecturocebus cupreus]